MPFNILLILGGLSAFGPLAIDLYLPAFPAMASSFGTDIEHIQLSMSVYFLGLASGQIFYGPLADRFGRRKPLLFGIALFALASLACALAPTLEWLLAARFAQALGGCAGMVVTRAVVRDLCKPIDAAKAFSQLMLVMGVAPILAPLGGGLFLKLGGWPLIFLFLAAFSSLFAVSSFRFFFALFSSLRFASHLRFDSASASSSGISSSLSAPVASASTPAPVFASTVACLSLSLSFFCTGSGGV